MMGKGIAQQQRSGLSFMIFQTYVDIQIDSDSVTMTVFSFIVYVINKHEGNTRLLHNTFLSAQLMLVQS